MDRRNARGLARLLAALVCVVATLLVPGVWAAAGDSSPRSVPLNDYHSLAHLLHGIIANDRLKYLQPHLQEYIVDRTLRNADPTLQLDEEEETQLWSLIRTYGASREEVDNWTQEDKDEVRRRTTQLVKLMKRRKEAESADLEL